MTRLLGSNNTTTFTAIPVSPLWCSVCHLYHVYRPECIDVRSFNWLLHLINNTFNIFNKQLNHLWLKAAGEQPDRLRCALFDIFPLRLILSHSSFSIWGAHTELTGPVLLYLYLASNRTLKDGEFQLLQIFWKQGCRPVELFWQTSLLCLSLSATCNCSLQFGWLTIVLE